MIYLILTTVTLLTQVIVLAWLSVMFVSGLISSKHGAPYVPIGRKHLSDLLEFGGLSSSDNFYDLGSGDGRVLITAAQDFHVRNATGYEAAPWPFQKSLWLIKRSRLANIKVLNKSFFDGQFGDATFIYIYLFPQLVDRLAGKLAGELRPATKILCLDFPVDPKRHPEFLLKKQQKIGTMTAYLYEKI